MFKYVLQASQQFHVHSVADAQPSVLTSVRMKLVEIRDVRRLSPEILDQLTKSFVEYRSSSSPATSAALPAKLPTRTVVFCPPGVRYCVIPHLLCQFHLLSQAM